MAFKLGDKRVNPLKSRGFMNASPFKSNGNTMAYANGEPEGGPEGKPKEKLVSSTSETTKIGEEKTPEQLAAEKARLQKIADETGDSQESIFEYGKGGSAESVWKTLSDEQKTKFGSVENFRKETDAYNERMSQKVNADPNAKPETKVNPRNVLKKADVKDKTIGTKLTTQEVDKGDQIQGGMQPVEEVYYETGYLPDGSRGKIKKTRTVYKKVENTKAKTEQQNREAVATTKDDKANAELDQNVVISSQGDKDQVDQAVEEQLEAQKKQGKTVDKS